MPLTPRPAGLVGGSATGLLALSGALAAQAQLAAVAKEDRAGVEAEGSRGEWTSPDAAGWGHARAQGEDSRTIKLTKGPAGSRVQLYSQWAVCPSASSVPLWASI